MKPIIIMVMVWAYQTLSAQARYRSEGTTYPERKLFFTGMPESYGERIAFRNQKDTSNSIIFDYNYVDLSDYMVPVAGYHQTFGTRNPEAIKMTESAVLPAALLNSTDVGISEKGFTVAFWTKWTYSPSLLTADIMAIHAPPYNAELDNIIFWKAGISYDRRVFVARTTTEVDVKPTGKANREPPRREKLSDLHLWDLKFWNPEYADIDQYATENQSDAQWFFVMIVQEKTQVRMHIGMPTGVFDCMYLNYGLDDRHHFGDGEKLTFFGNDDVLFLQDLSVWNVPLCREEAFEFYKDSRGAPGSTFRLNNSTIKSVVIADDSIRMQRDASRKCISSNSHRAPRSTKKASAFLMVSKKDMPNNGQDSFENEILGEVMLFPNPARSEINIKFPSEFVKDNSQAVDIALVDLNGRVLRSSKINLDLGSSTAGWRIPQSESLPNGIYVLKINILGKTFSGKVAIDCGCR